jgi:hypothetical protein
VLTKKPKDAAYGISSGRPEQFIEELAEPCLENVELGVGDRHRVGPIVRNGPRLNVVLRRAPDARLGHRLDVEIVRQNAKLERGRDIPGSMARRPRGRNGRILRQIILSLLGG